MPKPQSTYTPRFFAVKLGGCAPAAIGNQRRSMTREAYRTHRTTPPDEVGNWLRIACCLFNRSICARLSEDNSAFQRRRDYCTAGGRPARLTADLCHRRIGVESRRWRTASFAKRQRSRRLRRAGYLEPARWILAARSSSSRAPQLEGDKWQKATRTYRS